MEQRIKLRIMGISYNQLHQGAYALLLAQENGPYRIPIVIGSAEAHSIAIHLEHIKPPRPLTHDLMVSMANAFSIKIEEVFLYDFNEGIFSAEISLTDGERQVKLDSRASDAIALAIRTHAPIFTTQEVLDRTGFVLEKEQIIEDVSDADGNGDDEDDDLNKSVSDVLHESYMAQPKLENYTIDELERTLARLVDEENYEEAARVSEILDRKRGQSPDNQRPND